MQKIFGIDKYKFYLSNITTSIIYNEEVIKNKVINQLLNDEYLVIDAKVFNFNSSVRDYLKTFKFNMKLVQYFELNNIILNNYNELNFETKIYLKIILLINSISENVVFDDVLTFLSSKQKYLVLKFLKDNNIMYFNFTSDIEEVLFTKYLIILNEKGVLLEGKTKSVLNEEKILKHNGFSLPFVVDLSRQLKDYGVVEKEYYSIDRLVSDLWK